MKEEEPEIEKPESTSVNLRYLRHFEEVDITSPALIKEMKYLASDGTIDSVEEGIKFANDLFNGRIHPEIDNPKRIKHKFQ